MGSSTTSEPITTGDKPLDRKPFIVTLTGPIAAFRHELASAIPEAVLVQELSGSRAVVVVPLELQAALAELPAVISMRQDELRKPLRPGQS
jgi:hypothetical protein